MTSGMESEVVYRKAAEVASKLGLVNNIAKVVRIIRITSISNMPSHSYAAKADNSEIGNRWMRAETLSLRRIQMLQ